MLIGKPGCHLCDVAREVTERVIAELPDEVADAVEVREASINDDPALFDLWWEKIPVVLIDDRLHAHWRLDAGRLRSALTEASAGPAAPTTTAPVWTVAAGPGGGLQRLKQFAAPGR